MLGRGNGLTAASYTPIVDLSPQLADAMLDALRERGIAAYATPAASAAERLYVDAASRDLAARVLHTMLRTAEPPRRPDQAPDQFEEGAAGAVRPAGDEGGPETEPETEEDQAWQRIVASFDEPPSQQVPPWPASEDVPDRGDEASSARLVRSASDTPGGEADRDDEGHFVPPPPPPLPRADPVTKWAWLALFGGPAYLLLAAMFGWNVPGWAAFAAVASFVGGFVTLVVRMGDDPPRDSGPDDGAVV